MASKELDPKDNSDKEQSNDKNELDQLRSQFKILEDKNKHLKKDLNEQVQVNSELKKLLVASLGEDLEARVQHLTEDKLQLSRALIDSSTHLSTHQEQVEWLAGQCEVWRSKFLAASLMVEELGRWKTMLNNHTSQLQESLKKLLDEREKIKVDISKTLLTLKIIAKCQNLEAFEEADLNVIEMTSQCQAYAETLKELYLSDNGSVSDFKFIDGSSKTQAEIEALEVLSQTNTNSQYGEQSNQKSTSNEVYNSFLIKNRCEHCNAVKVNL